MPRIARATTRAIATSTAGRAERATGERGGGGEARRRRDDLAASGTRGDAEQRVDDAHGRGRAAADGER